ncbi:MAG TPA: 50S ribosomal protein L25/general stress protein Ctc [Gemmatimonadaceae bacterium]|nr:50S ribosomal protein L25/general stress protein Ctc [Gemmatimonadaceae bacterium]
MATASLGANPRKETGKGVARKLRAQGQVPGVIYGHGREPQALTVNAREFERLAERVRITSTVIELALDGKTARTLVRELQRDPIRRSVIHIDFQELVAGEKVVVSVPLRFVGTADGVKNSGGILEEVIHQLHVRCDPANIPDHIDVDVTPLTIGHGLHVSDLKLPEGVETTDDPETTVATVSAPVVEEEVAPAAAEGALAAPEAAAEPELIRKPKAEEEGEEQES